jgi:hypothetical protein
MDTHHVTQHSAYVLCYNALLQVLEVDASGSMASHRPPLEFDALVGDASTSMAGGGPCAPCGLLNECMGAIAGTVALCGGRALHVSTPCTLFAAVT